MFLFITFNVGAVFFHLCRYGDEPLSWTVEFSPVLFIMKILFVTFVCVVFLTKSSVFKSTKEYKAFLFKNIIFISPVALVPMGIYYMSSSGNQKDAINNFSILIGIIALGLFIFCISYLIFKLIKK